jgi:hypothetical protein
LKLVYEMLRSPLCRPTGEPHASRL